MKSGKTRRIVTLASLWILIGAVWIVGLNWPRIVSGGAETVRSADSAKAQPDSGEMQTVIYTLSDTLSDEDPVPADPLPERGLPEPAEPETAAAPAAEPAPENPPPTDGAPDAEPVSPEVAAPYVLNTHTKKIHLPDCPSVTEMKESNRGFCEDPEEMLAQGYAWCKRCHG